jgi:methyl-accepting chemotaxis protein
MSAALERIVGGVRGSSEALSSASGQIAVGKLDLFPRTEEQDADAPGHETVAPLTPEFV